MPGKQLTINSQMPEFRNLPGVDNQSYSSSDFDDQRILIIVFSCNHCPYVQAYEDRMIALQQEYSGKGVQLVAVNSNDIKNYPDDSFEHMIQRAKKKRFNFPYLRDEQQSIAEAFGATHTPQFFVFDAERILRYSGKMDDNWKEPQAVNEHYLRDVLNALLEGKEIQTPETFSIGCTIKWS